MSFFFLQEIGKFSKKCLCDNGLFTVNTVMIKPFGEKEEEKKNSGLFIFGVSQVCNTHFEDS